MPQANVSEAEPHNLKAGKLKRKTSTARILGCYHLAEILRRKSTARISACLNALRDMLNSSGNSAAEIHSENFPSLNLTSSQLAIRIDVADSIRHSRQRGEADTFWAQHLASPEGILLCWERAARSLPGGPSPPRPCGGGGSRRRESRPTAAGTWLGVGADGG